MEWFMGHLVEIGVVYVLVIQVLTKIEELIPDDKDAWLRKILEILKKFALLVPSKKN